MFSPIKKIFTYIQKNASGSTMFGGSHSVTDECQKEANKLENELKAMEQRRSSDIKLESNSEVEVRLHNVAVEIDDGDGDGDTCEDFEKHIKSNIMIRKSLKDVSCSGDGNYNVDKLSSLSHVVTVETPEARDYFVADCSAEASVDNGGEEMSAEFNTEEDEDEDDLVEPFLDLDTFQNNEIIVLSDTDPNSSIASEATSEDPLAIDDFTQRITETDIESENPLESAVAPIDYNDASGDLLWLKLGDNAEPNDETVDKASTRIAQNAHTPKTSSGEAVTDSGNHKEEQPEELRSDGSDSGLGSETSTLQTTMNSVLVDTSQAIKKETLSLSLLASTKADALKCEFQTIGNKLKHHIFGPTMPKASTEPKKPLRSNLKRRLEEVEAEMDALDVGLGSTTHHKNNGSAEKKLKRSINFDTVQVYYFPRQQGFGCVPTAGGCTLGMGAQHISFKTLTLAEHAAELRRAHRMQLQVNPRASSSEDSEESEEDYLSEGSGSDLDTESSGFLQPVSPKQRRALLKAAGVRKIDASEKVECRDIRNSREFCGCSCRDFCDPETCACSQAGIKCQVDRAMFPCGCSREACGNAVGRVEFNPARVRTHYIHTVMRLELENRQQLNPTALSYSLSNATSSYYNRQTPSNYSSGYASPAYTSDSTTNYYQTQQQHQTPALHQQKEDKQQQSQSTTSYGLLQELHTPQYQLDSLDSNLFSGTNNATPSYGELLPPTFHNLNYIGNSSNSLTSELSTYASYHHHQPSSSSYITSTPSTFSSCAVPSAPPFGSATTTAATSPYHHNILETTNASNCSGNNDCSSTITTAAMLLATSSPSKHGTLHCGASDGSFINLNTPIASSSRLSQINDLLQHNRNATAALVAVSQSPSSIGFALNSCANAATINSAAAAAITAASINTPPIEDVHKSCLLSYEELPPPLNPSPIVAVVQPLQAPINKSMSPPSSPTSSPTSPSSPPSPPPTTRVQLSPPKPQCEIIVPIVLATDFDAAENT